MAAYLIWQFGLGFDLAIVAIGLALPLVTIYQLSRGWPRRTMTWYAAGLALLGVGCIVADLVNLETTSTLVTAFILGAVATPWLANYLATARGTR